MAHWSSTNVGDLTVHLSSLADFLAGIARLRTLLLHSSPSYLVSQPEELISLIEVAKNTLKRSGVRLHSFSSCADRLRPYKAAYFGLLTQLQTHSHNTKLESKDLQVRFSRLLFPLATQLKLYADASDDTTVLPDPAQNFIGDSGLPDVARQISNPQKSTLLSSSSTMKADNPTSPPDVMLPPPMPLQPGILSIDADALEEDKPWDRTAVHASRPRHSGFLPPCSPRRHVSRDTVHFKHRNPEPDIVSGSPTTITFYPGVANVNSSALMDVDEDEDDTSGSDEELPSVRIVVPARSPLRRSFGIFCTGKGRGTFSGGRDDHRHRHRDHGHERFTPPRGGSVHA